MNRSAAIGVTVFVSILFAIFFREGRVARLAAALFPMRIGGTGRCETSANTSTCTPPLNLSSILPELSRSR